MNTGHTNVNDLLDLNDFNPNNEKEQYRGFHENADKYASQSMKNEHGYPENTPPPEMFLHTLDKSRSAPTNGIRDNRNGNPYEEEVKENYISQHIPEQFPQPYHQPQQNNPFQPQQIHKRSQIPSDNYEQTPESEVQENFKQIPMPPQEVFQHQHHGHHHDAHSCLGIADHVQHCRICSRYYDTDKTIYLVIIVILLIICALLIRKVLNL